MPISLLLAGQPCLVVGGGKVALRKTGHLLDAEATVSVISPELCDEMSKWVSAGKIRHIARPFEAADIKDAVLVFAATNDRHVNRQILEACREKKILCSCVDGNWAQGDFTTPATARHGNLTLTVSTGGQCCRQAKLVKDSLAKHLEMVETVELVVVGTDHHHLSLEEREPFHVRGDRLERTGFMLMQLWGVHEFMILNTCNRIEVIAVVSRETARNGILRHILGFDKLDENQFYIHRGAAAFEQLSLVTSGMLSQTPGESHIAAQVKEALATAQQAGWANSLMQEWVSSLLHVSKHIQTDVAPKLHKEEIEDLALHYLEARHPDLSTKTLLVLGAGVVGQGFVRDASPKVGKTIWCYHKNKPDLSNLWKNAGEEFHALEKRGGTGSACLKNVELCTLNGIEDRIGEADVIVSASEAPGHILHSGHAPFFDQEKKRCLIDLGMPRNIDPALANLSPGLSLIDLDGLKRRHQTDTSEMEEIFRQCHRLIHDHLEQYERIINSFQSRNA